jgi:antitoxin ParD1/3/4
MEHCMSKIDIQLPPMLDEWVSEQTRTGRYTDAGDYLRDLIRRDKEYQSDTLILQALVDEGLASGVSDESMDDILTSLHR